MRNINDLTTWKEYEKKLFKRKGFKKLSVKNEPQFQLVRSLISARLKKNLSQNYITVYEKYFNFSLPIINLPALTS